MQSKGCGATWKRRALAVQAHVRCPQKAGWEQTNTQARSVISETEVAKGPD